MANPDVEQELADAMLLVAAAIPVMSVLSFMASQNEAAHSAVRQNANAATLELATTANSVALVLGGQPTPPKSVSIKNVEKMLQVLLSQNSGAPVVT